MYMRPDITLTDDTCTLPKDMTDLLTREQLADIFEMPANGIEHFPNWSDSDNLKGYFIWEEDGLSDNRGLFISIKRNSQYAEYGDDYVFQTVDNLKSLGETDEYGQNIIYKNLEGLGTSGAYSEISNTYYVQLDNCVLFKLVLNSTIPLDSQTENSKKVLEIIISSYYNYIGY